MDIVFESTFTDDDKILNDDTLTNVYRKNEDYVKTAFQKEHACALFKYIIDNADDKIYNPDCVRERTRCYVQGQDTFAIWFQENYEITGDKDDILKLKTMFEHYKESDDYQNMRKDDRPNLQRFKMMSVLTDNKLSSRFREMHQYYVEGKQKTQRSVLVGIKKIEQENDDDVYL